MCVATGVYIAVTKLSLIMLLPYSTVSPSVSAGKLKTILERL